MFQNLFRDMNVLIPIILALLATLWMYWRNLNKFWQRKGLPVLKSRNFEFFTGKISSHDFSHSIYNECKSKSLKHAGTYFLGKPLYIPKDLGIIKNILVRDFDHFVDRGVYYNEESDPLSANLFTIEGERWRHLRAKLSPTFTSGKMKMMFPILGNCASSLIDSIEKKQNVSIDVKDELGKFTTDVIGSCAFGIDCNSFQEPETELRKYSKRIFSLTYWELFINFMSFAFPTIMKKFGATQNPVEASKFFLDTMKKTIRYREQHNISRKDFLHLLLLLKNKGTTEDEKPMEKSVPDGLITENEVAAQAFLFFIAGFETSSTTMCMALYELSKRQDVQEKLRNEIVDVIGKHGGALTYEAMNEMTYLAMVLDETLRKYPPLAVLNRRCTKAYKIPDDDIVLDKDVVDVWIPIVGIHYDEEYYPNPEKFDPERFSHENKSKRPHMTYMPFGEGPRNCVGLRFGLMQSKVGLCSLLTNFRICSDPKTIEPLKSDPTSFTYSVKGGIWLQFEKICSK